MKISAILSFRCSGAGKHIMSEHLLSDKLASSGVCRDENFRSSVIRVRRRVQEWQVSHSWQLGAIPHGMTHLIGGKVLVFGLDAMIGGKKGGI
jgi:hypothetical protein